MNKTMAMKKVKTVSDLLKKYDYVTDNGRYITVTEWANGEGWDVCINSEQTFSITRGELSAINFLTGVLDYADESIVQGNS